MLVPQVEVGLEGTRGTDQFRPLRVILLQQVNPPLGEFNFVMTHPGVMIIEPLTSNIHAKGVITAIGLWETGAIVVITSGKIGITVRTVYPDQSIGATRVIKVSVGITKTDVRDGVPRPLIVKLANPSRS